MLSLGARRRYAHWAIPALLICASSAWAGISTPSAIEGPDPYEPDNAPVNARWLGVLDEGDENRTATLHNFDVPGDEDWGFFYASEGMFVFIRTRDLLQDADTFLSVYRLLDEGEEGPEVAPQDCAQAVVQGFNGRNLAALACNDDAPFEPGTRRSQVELSIEKSGLYFVRVQHADKYDNDKSNTDTKNNYGPETTYVLEVTYFGVLLGNLFVAVQQTGTNAPITNAVVTLQPLGIRVTVNANGIYSIPGLPQDTYVVTATAPLHVATNQSIFVKSGDSKAINAYLAPLANEHSADFLLPKGKIDLSELLRVIQLYNADGLHCDPSSEDGYAVYGGDVSCAPHALDYLPQDWTIGLSELLRCIQLYNATGYYPCVGSEDHFCVSV